MIKVSKGSIEITGTAETLTAEVGNLLRHIFPTMAEYDKIEAAAAFNVAGKAMADAAEVLVEKYRIGLDALNMRNEMDDEEEDEDSGDEDMMREFLDTLSPKELKSLLEIIEKFDEYADEEEDD